jgi:PAS domain S-box-containing protein
VAALVLQTFLFFIQPLNVRIIANSLLLIPIFTDAALPLLGTPLKGCRFGYRFSASVLMFGCVAACVRIVAIFYLREHPSPYFSAHPTNTLFFFLIMFVLVAMAFGFIALTHERLVAELEFTHERFRLLYENAPLGVTMIDQSGRITSANRQFEEIIGYSPEEIPGLGLTAADLAVPEDKAAAEESVGALLSRNIQVDDREMRLIRKDGGTRWVRSTATLMGENLGKPKWGIATFEDISKRKQAEEALRQSEERFTEKLQEYLAIHQKKISA